jgi:Mn2+/Fe2+ NRAMP family transporter
MLGHLGPGFILSASIVGSGELIATTQLGARAGFVTLWVIIASCLVKVAVQLEFGKHAIDTGETTMESLNKLPGPRFGSAHWTIWLWLALMSVKLLQMGGIVGGVALILQILTPGTPLPLLASATAFTVAVLVFGGHYRLIEKTSLVMMGLFTAFTLVSLLLVQSTTYAITWEQLASGMTFSLPPAAVVVALGAFGITGVGGDEIMAYNYWLIEKGYAAHTGPNQDTQEWADRARGWIRVMYWDALLAMVVYTVVTTAFYLLGAAILHAQQLVPEKDELVETLSQIYTQTLGPGARVVFLLGALAVLFSTLLAALAAWTRMFSDAFSRLGLFDFHDEAARNRSIAVCAWCFPIVWTVLYLFFEAPAIMVIIGGLATVVILLIVVFAAIDFRYYRLDPRLAPTRWYDAYLWLSIASIIGVAIYGMVQLT